jgi:hypothetical protein
VYRSSIIASAVVCFKLFEEQTMATKFDFLPARSPVSELFEVSPETRAHHQKLILSALRCGPVTTIYCREALGVQSPAPRVLELRKAGWQIATNRRRVFDEHGRQHTVAEYVLNQNESGVAA